MLANFAIIFIITMLFALMFKKLRMPELLGMIFAGILLGPIAIKLGIPFSQIISKEIYNISDELRTAALIVILIRAGLGINKEMLNKIGFAAFKMSFIPCICEGLVVMFAVNYLMGWPWIVCGVLAFVLAAVSPAVVVPEMLRLKESGFGKKREIPTLVMAGASVDDVFAITIFGAFLGLAVGKEQNIVKIAASVPAGIISGIILGVFLGFGLLHFFTRYKIRDTKKVIIFMITAILFHYISEVEFIKGIIPVASFIGIMAMGFILLEKNDKLANRLAMKFNKVWVFAEIILFVLIGAKVDLDKAFGSDILLYGLLIILIALAARTIGVFIALAGSELKKSERLFCAFAYLPKATVQAAIGAIPLSMGVSYGKDILSIAVLSIIVTAPLGAILIKYSAPKLLDV